MGRIEHVNVTVSDADRSAALMQVLFGWHIRWSGAASDGGRAVHVGEDDQYLAFYTPPGGAQGRAIFTKGRPLNHVGIAVDDLKAAKARVRAAGLEPFGFGDYAPGRRFYFFDPDGTEYEVVSYG